ncbi:hypothetical protein [Bradyrhizobium sp. WSM2254]|uniref:hypothetical protein n=1 Tax=Bradyrhizobium sp. WSM2254 TaxID=1188263 RepID=UPI000427D65B|nr:hypothetical protein [Bradyrhizobium sp. WSM2254]
MTKNEAAGYCGCVTTAAFDVWIRKGIVPPAIPGTNRWDRKAIDAALDRASSIDDKTRSVSLLAEWKANKAVSR